MNFDQLANILKQDEEFFINYKDKFREEFIKNAKDEKNPLLGVKSLQPLVDKLYILLFSFNKYPFEELYNLTYKLAHHEVDFKKPITKPLLKMIKDYIDLVAEREEGYKRIKALISLIDLYFETMEKAYSKYINELRSDLKGTEKEIIKGEREVILKLLRKFYERGYTNIIILTFYKEMPVACKSQILEIVDKFLRVKTIHIKAFSIGDRVYIKHGSVAETIASRIINVNVIEEIIELEIIGFVELPQDKRQHVRVEPEKPTKVKIHKGDWKVEGLMADISVGGVGVFVKDKDDLKKYDIVTVSFELPKGKITAEGEVRYVTLAEDTFRIGIKLNLDIHQEEAVNDYIMERQLAILKELKD